MNKKLLKILFYVCASLLCIMMLSKMIRNGFSADLFSAMLGWLTSINLMRHV